MITFFELLERIRLRPGLFLEYESIFALRAFLLGYLSAKDDMDLEVSDDEKRFSKFQEWIEEKYNVERSPDSWVTIIRADSKNDAEALQKFFTYLEEFKRTVQ